MSKTDSEPVEEMSQAAIQVTSQKGNDERGTPLEFIRKLQNAIGGQFSLDPCSGAEPTPIAEHRFTAEDNGLAQSWAGYETVYVNPPYSDLDKWLKKIDREASRNDGPRLIMALLPGNTSTQWFHQHAAKGDYLILIEGRLTFHGTDQSAPFASILTVFGTPEEETLERLDPLGTIYTREEIQTATEQAQLEDLFETDGGSVATTERSSAGTGPLDGPGPDIRDLSKQAPAVPQGIIDFTRIGIHDTLHLEFAHSIMGTPSDLPEQVDMTVLGGEPANMDNAQTPEDWHTLTGVAKSPDGEIFITFQQDPTSLSTIECSIALPNDTWEHVSIESLYRYSANQKPAINTYGSKTAYVC